MSPRKQIEAEPYPVEFELSKTTGGLSGSAKFMGARHFDPYRVGLSAIPGFPCAISITYAERILPEKLLGGRGGKRAGN